LIAGPKPLRKGNLRTVVPTNNRSQGASLAPQQINSDKRDLAITRFKKEEIGREHQTVWEQGSLNLLSAGKISL